tara:strand:+ start:566 stop:1564 length:999 start_codon:yes stop_codon:yes gene_type:complete
LSELQEPVLNVSHLTTEFALPSGTGKAVDDLSFEILKGETLGIVGESGCGKSMTALSILNLVPSPPGKISAGKILFENKNLLEFNDRRMREVRGKDISMIFQEPMTSLNPVLTIGYQIEEVLQKHLGLPKAEARKKTIGLLELVKIPEAEKRAGQFPHQLSGGMRQRAMIAMALACEPKILIADEPTTALDVTIQAQVLGLIRELRDRLNTAILLITHDLGVIAENADRVIVMYAGKKIEEAPVIELFESPQHPYTQGLLRSVPSFNETESSPHFEPELLEEIKGTVPPLDKKPPGCSFAPRCDIASERCQQTIPALRKISEQHLVACWNIE